MSSQVYATPTLSQLTRSCDHSCHATGASGGADSVRETAARKQAAGVSLERVAQRERVAPGLRDRVHTVVRAGELSIHGARRVRIVSEVDREERALAERRRGRERPQRRLEGFNHVAGAANLVTRPTAERAGCDLLDLGRERLALPQIRHRRKQWREQFVFAPPLQRADDEPGEIAAGV